jgi:hypothetical protein
MTFDEILAQVLDLLQRQGRMSYSALRRRFEIDDAYLDDLKDELMFAHPVVDEDGRGLVWTGETEAAPVTLSQPDQPEPRCRPRHLAPDEAGDNAGAVYKRER